MGLAGGVVILWEIARASAFVAFGCYTLVVAWGVILAGRGWRPAAPQLGFHRFLSSLALVALTLHISSVLLDHYARVPVTGLVGVGVRPAVMLGVGALWLALALPISFRLKRAGFMSNRSWRLLHYFGYAVWGLALLHGIAAGTDSRSYPAIAAYAVSGAIVAASAWWRWVERPTPGTDRRSESGTLALSFPPPRPDSAVK
jgi:methionine sulfoxide reductase heme-binding subunit